MKEATPELWWKVSVSVTQLRGTAKKYVCHVCFWELDRALLDRYIAATFRDKRNANRDDKLFAQGVAWDHFRNLQKSFELEGSEPIPRADAPTGEPTFHEKEKGWRLWVKEA